MAPCQVFQQAASAAGFALTEISATALQVSPQAALRVGAQGAVLFRYKNP